MQLFFIKSPVGLGFLEVRCLPCEIANFETTDVTTVKLIIAVSLQVQLDPALYPNQQINKGLLIYHMKEITG